MQKKGLWFFAVLLIVIIASVFYFKDGRDMDKIETEHLESAADSADSKLDILNEEFEDMDFDESEIEEATLAYDTLSNS